MGCRLENFGSKCECAGGLKMKTDKVREQEIVNCLNCKEPTDLSQALVKIGHLKGMVTKSFECSKCGKTTNYSKSVGERSPILKAILGEYNE
jgi:C4-type Zn-finger protein